MIKASIVSRVLTLRNMINFADSYKKDLMTVVLTNNYRSTQPILDISKSVDR
jgi:DNA helicase-2/ATP-dependent DNA helicase PcrA